jgi:hypothetical protein
MALLHHHPARTVGAAIAWDPGEVRALDRFEAAVADG